MAPLDGGYPLKALQVPNQVAALMAQHAKVGQLHRASVMFTSYQEMHCNPLSAHQILQMRLLVMFFLSWDS